MRPVRFPAIMALAAVSGLLAHPATLSAGPVRLDVVERAISSAAARQMVSACLNLAAARGWKVQVAVVDRSGALVAFGRSDGASSGGQDISLAKARTAARFGWSTERFAQLAWSSDTGSPGPLAFAAGTTGIPGGLPIHMSGGELIGGIGVSGSLPPNDKECAEASLQYVGAGRHLP